ncbi:MAG: DUF5688 family protein [Lachnospiraceae bacterium]|nr:DUF5688 family protein [Lachnospiraceae bacterium]
MVNTTYLTQDEFLEELKEGLTEELSEHDLQFDQQTVHKANEDLEGLTVRMMDRDDGKVGVNIYPEKEYERYLKGTDLKDIVHGWAEAVGRTTPEFDLNSLTAESAKDHISFSLVNTKENEEWLKTVPHEEIGDLSAIPRWHLEDIPDGRASFVVTDQVAQNLQMTKEEVLSIARKNTENENFSVSGMSDTMTEIMRGQGLSEEYIEEMVGPMRDHEQMYVITNDSKIDGSSAMLSDAAMQAAYERIYSCFLDADAVIPEGKLLYGDICNISAALADNASLSMPFSRGAAFRS